MGMANLKDRRCEQHLCTIQPTFAFPGEKPRFCSKHKAEGHVNVRHKLCRHPQCKLVPTYGMRGTRVPVACLEHSEGEMVDLKRERMRMAQERKKAPTETAAAAGARTMEALVPGAEALAGTAVAGRKRARASGGLGGNREIGRKIIDAIFTSSQLQLVSEAEGAAAANDESEWEEGSAEDKEEEEEEEEEEGEEGDRRSSMSFHMPPPPLPAPLSAPPPPTPALFPGVVPRTCPAPQAMGMVPDVAAVGCTAQLEAVAEEERGQPVGERVALFGCAGEASVGAGGGVTVTSGREGGSGDGGGEGKSGENGSTTRAGGERGRRRSNSSGAPSSSPSNSRCLIGGSAGEDAATATATSVPAAAVGCTANTPSTKTKTRPVGAEVGVEAVPGRGLERTMISQQQQGGRQQLQPIPILDEIGIGTSLTWTCARCSGVVPPNDRYVLVCCGYGVLHQECTAVFVRPALGVRPSPCPKCSRLVGSCLQVFM
ncbi:unnamed protein product [Ectocarpus sp. 8 AP-2014]